MNLYPDSKDLINLISKNQPMSPADFANLLRANNWALAFSFVNVAEVMIREDLPLCRERLRVIETLPARFIQVFTNIVKLELQAAVEAFNSAQEFVRPDPYVDRWYQTYTPPGRADYQEMLVNYRLEDQVIPLVYGNPAILQNVRSGGDFYRAAVAQDRNAADTWIRRENRFFQDRRGRTRLILRRMSSAKCCSSDDCRRRSTGRFCGRISSPGSRNSL